MKKEIKPWIFIAMAIPVAIASWLLWLWAVGASLPCGDMSTERGKLICSVIERQVTVTVNPHSFTPQAHLPFDHYKAAWCEAGISSKDRGSLVEMTRSESRVLKQAGEGLLKLLTGQESGKEPPDVNGASGFNPADSFYLLKGGCSK